MADKFKVEGDLWPVEQSFLAYADDSFVLRERDAPAYKGPRLDDLVAEYFGVERMLDGNRHIGQVRITIERLDD